jgi:hypothetical protein
MNKFQAAEYSEMILCQWPDTPSINRGEIEKALMSLDIRKAPELLESMKALPPTWRIGAKDVEAKAALLRDNSEQLGFAITHWLCQVCGHGFDFCYAPESDGPYKKVYAFCPECGFIPMVKLFKDGPKLYYRGDVERYELFKLHHGTQYAEINARRGFYSNERDRKSEFKALEIKGLLPDKRYENFRSA